VTPDNLFSLEVGVGTFFHRVRKKITKIGAARNNCALAWVKASIGVEFGWHALCFNVAQPRPVLGIVCDD